MSRKPPAQPVPVDMDEHVAYAEETTRMAEALWGELLLASILPWRWLRFWRTHLEVRRRIAASDAMRHRRAAELGIPTGGKR
jgi:hypothetical protein